MSAVQHTPGPVTDEQRALLRAVGRESAWQDLLRRFSHGQRRHIANLLAHSYTITAIEIEDAYGSRPGRIVGEVSREDANAAMKEVRDRKRATGFSSLDIEERIVQCVNAHDELVRHLERCANYLESAAKDAAEPLNTMLLVECAKDARAAIAKTTESVVLNLKETS